VKFTTPKNVVVKRTTIPHRHTQTGFPKSNITILVTHNSYSCTFILQVP